MITVRELDPYQKEVKTIPFEQHKVGGALSWVDVIEPTDEDFAALSAKTGISVEDLKDSVDDFKRPHVVPLDRYSIIILRAPYDEGEGMISTTPVGIFLFRRDVITIHTKRIRTLDVFRELPNSQKVVIFRKGPAYFAYRFIEAGVEDYFHILDQVEEEIDKIEDQVLREPTALVTQRVFRLKRTLIYAHKSLSANKDVISAIEKQYLKDFSQDDIKRFRDLYNDTTQLLDMVSTYRDILTSILDMYLSSVSNNLNKVMKTLTLISAFVLVPALISGIYGMNFKLMPEISWAFGYPFALGLMALSILSFYFFFKRKGWIGWP